ncbi:IS3 family transposase [Leuconostoc gasicomitatum]|uniref:IS3 family transposase n=1 Tax=Leuconostoc gasicomitatum TaxID=115778 RepID=UPI001CC74082
MSSLDYNQRPNFTKHLRQCENFNSLLKREMIYQFRFSSIAHLILDVAKHINSFNNGCISIAIANCKLQNEH